MRWRLRLRRRVLRGVRRVLQRVQRRRLCGLLCVLTNSLIKLVDIVPAVHRAARYHSFPAFWQFKHAKHVRDSLLEPRQRVVLTPFEILADFLDPGHDETVKFPSVCRLVYEEEVPR